MRILVLLFSITFFISCSVVGHKSASSNNKLDEYGKKTGVWVENEKNSISVYKYKNDLRHGKYRSYFENGDLSIKGHYFKGKKNGKFISYTGSYHFIVFRIKGSVIHFKNGESIKSKTFNSGL